MGDFSTPNILEYIWLDADGGIRSKIRTLKNHTFKHSSESRGIGNCSIDPDSVPIWNYDGSSTGQGTTARSEVQLIPVKIYHHPFSDDYPTNIKCFVVLCETYNGFTDAPLETNSRHAANVLFNKFQSYQPLYGLEQEFFFFNRNTRHPFEYSALSSELTNEIKQGLYYCGNGSSAGVERKIMNDFIGRALNCGLTISGINQEVAPSQWEFQVGPALGISAGDHFIMARFILLRVAEKEDLSIIFHPKPFLDWNGSGCHVNFSTKQTRQSNGIADIYKIINIMSSYHQEFVEKLSGKENDKRLTGGFETSSSDKFTWGVGSRDTSVRIPNQVEQDKKGYFEDRRPASNLDSYRVTAELFKFALIANGENVE
jgi:glutamine synthetase